MRAADALDVPSIARVFNFIASIYWTIASFCGCLVYDLMLTRFELFADRLVFDGRKNRSRKDEGVRLLAVSVKRGRSIVKIKNLIQLILLALMIKN